MENEEKQPVQEIENQTPQGHALQNQKPNMFKSKFFLGFVVLSVLIAFLIGGFALGKNNASKKVACTMEAKVCPDGSSVGRSGPKCEFSPCPTSAPDPTANWKTYTENSYSFKYPSDGNLIETQLEENPNSIFLGKSIQINLSPNKGHPTIYIRTARKTVFDESQKTESITLNGLPAVQAKYIDSFKNYQDIIEFKKDNLFYNLDLEMDSSINTSDAVKVFSQILSTFKFSTSKFTN